MMRLTHHRPYTEHAQPDIEDIQYWISIRHPDNRSDCYLLLCDSTTQCWTGETRAMRRGLQAAVAISARRRGGAAVASLPGVQPLTARFGLEVAGGRRFASSSATSGESKRPTVQVLHNKTQTSYVQVEQDIAVMQREIRDAYK